jgi:hypothetical protein
MINRQLAKYLHTKVDLEMFRNPSSVNFFKMQLYNHENFSTDEIIFFEFLVLKAKSFGYQEFHYSARKIEAEIGMGRSLQERMIRKFVGLGILQFEVRGCPQEKHFTVIFDKVIHLLPSIYQLEEINKINAEISKFILQYYKQIAEEAGRINDDMPF